MKSRISKSIFALNRFIKFNRNVFHCRHYSNTTRSKSNANSRASAFNLTNLVLFSSGVIAGVYLNQKALLGNFTDNSTSSTTPLSSLPGDPVYAWPSVEKLAIEEIRKIVGDEHVSNTNQIIENHSDSDWQTRHKKNNETPKIVVYPGSTDDVSKILKICHKYHIPVTAFSGGTSLEGHFTPVYGGISLDMTRMNRIIDIHKNDLDVVVQPAVGWEELNEKLRNDNLFFGPDPGPGAHIGGMIATSCSGTNAYRYGTMRQNVISLTVVLADGTVIKTRQRPAKTSAGYSLTDIFIGSEGTLGIVTEATLKVRPRLPFSRVGLLTFNNIEQATDTVASVVQSGFNLDAMELMDDEMMKLINSAGITKRKWNEKPTLLLRFAASTKNSIIDQIEEVKKISKTHGSLKLEFASDEEESELLWSARKNALWSVFSAAPQNYKVWTTDVAVPISHLSDIIAETKQDMKMSNINGAVLGHVGDGNFHAILTYDPETQTQQTSEVVHRMVMRALKFGGTCTGEHGVGVGKRKYLIQELGQNAVDAMRKLKQAYDPLFILNPGKVVSISAENDVSDH